MRKTKSSAKSFKKYRKSLLKITGAVTLVIIIIFLTRFSYIYGKNKALNSFKDGMGPCNVLILDQLEDDFPNPQLISNLVILLEKANCSVTVIPGKSFRVSSFRILKYYNVIIFRGHTGWANVYNPATGELKVYVALFTGESYSPYLYKDLQEKGYIAEGIPLSKPKPNYNKTYIAVTQYYLKKYLTLRKNTTIILSTCFAGTDILAKIFLNKGASLVVGWNSNVSVAFADSVLKEIVKNYVTYKSWEEAVSKLPMEYRRDPSTGAILKIYSKG